MKNLLLPGLLLLSFSAHADVNFKSDRACFKASNPAAIQVTQTSSKGLKIVQSAKSAQLELYTLVRKYIAGDTKLPVHEELKMAAVSYTTETGANGVAEGYNFSGAGEEPFVVECDGGSMTVTRNSDSGIANVQSRLIRTISDCESVSTLVISDAKFDLVSCK